MNPLRVLLPGDEDKAKRTLNLWKGASLLKNALTEAADMLHSRDMVVMEDLGEDALPVTTTTDFNQSLGERHSQLGADAASKLLASMRSPTSELAAFVVVDLSTRTGDFGKAVLNIIQDFLVPVHHNGSPRMAGTVSGWIGG